MAKKKTSAKQIILVTGVAGFMGSNFINYMVEAYPHYFFIGVDALTGIATKDNITVFNKKNLVFYRCDIRDRIELQKIFFKHKPGAVIHYAAETHVDLSIKNPI